MQLAIKYRKRTAQRGAALVEAAVVIPVMLVFLGLTMFVHDAYDKKMALQMSARSEVLYYASHDCEEQAPPEMSKQLGAGVSGNGIAVQTTPDEAAQGSGQLDSASAKLGGADHQVSRTDNMAQTSREEIVHGSAVSEGKRVYFDRRVASRSEALCNQKRYDLETIWSTVKGLAKKGVSFL